ncbi:MAG: NIPSNAP family protein [Thermomicrobiales bacterium]|nr:NIPSNAP family protein [Thermomicrobiales bacterium]
MTRVIEIRTYALKPGSRGDFHRLVVEQSMPMLERWHVEVVAYGPSTHDDNSYYLIRAYDDLFDRQRSQDAFYGSAEWREGPREAIVSLIESDISVVVELDDVSIDGLRTIPRRPVTMD